MCKARDRNVIGCGESCSCEELRVLVFSVCLRLDDPKGSLLPLGEENINLELKKAPKCRTMVDLQVKCK